MISALLTEVNIALLKVLTEREKKNPLYQPIDYTLLLGGKRIRPILVLLSSNLFEGKEADALKIATAIEVFHNFTLLHDDIMDAAEIRRNKTTAHKKWGINQAILSGDVMLIKAYQLLSEIDPLKIPALLKVFNKTSIEVCEGQQLDMDFEKREVVSSEEYLEMIRLKTAVLLGASLEMGAINAGVDEKISREMYAIGEKLGIGFQMQDDYLDTFGKQESFGKKIGGDIIASKKTYLYTKALSLANEKQLKKLFYLYTSKTITEEQKVIQVRDLFKELRVNEIVLKEIETIFNESIFQFQKIKPISLEHYTLLENLFKSFYNRSV